MQPTLPTPAGGGDALYTQIGRDPKADLAYALATGGFKMAEAAGKPGATFLSALGAGGNAAVEGTVAARSRARAEDQADELMGIKRTTAKATLMKALKEGTTDVQKLIEYRDKLPAGSKERDMVQNIIDKKGDINEGLGEVEKLVRLRETYAKGSTDWNRINNIIEKKGRDQKSEASQIIEAMNKGVGEQEKALGKKLGERQAEIITNGDLASATFGTLSTLHVSMNKSIAAGSTPGGFAGAFDELSRYAESVGAKLGFELPPEARSNSQFQLSTALQKTLVRDLLKSKMGARPSDRDLSFMIETLPNMGFGAEANQMLINGLYENALTDVEKSVGFLKHRKDSGKSEDTYFLTEQSKARDSMYESLLDRVSEGWVPTGKLKQMMIKYAQSKVQQ
jgi:hypothetical protein